MLETAKLSLRFRLTLLITLLTAVLTISFTSYFILHEQNTQISRLRNKGELLASILSNSIQIPLYAGNDEEVAMHASEIFSNGDICGLKIYNRKRELIISAFKGYNTSGCSGLTVTKSFYSNSNQFSPEALLLGEVPPDTPTGAIELEMETAQLQLLTKKLILVSSLLALAFWLAANSITFLLLKRLTSTFELLMSGVKRIEEGDLSARIPVTGSDEPGRALAAINSLSETLQKKTAENERLQAEVVKGLSLQIDEEKNRHMAKLIQTNRMTSLGLLVSSMAHEINNPNGVIRLAAEILERGWKEIQAVLDEVARSEGDFMICGVSYSDAIEDFEKAVEGIMRSSIRIENVVQNLRTYSLGDREKQLMAFDINRVAENSVAIVRAHGKMEGITINTIFAPDLPAAFGNPFQLEQVVINLLLNAIQALSANDDKIITLSTEKSGNSGELLLVVSDNGPGITSANLPHIFEPFFSTRIDKGGSGLGLYISDFIVKEQNGTLEIVNNESGGCRAVVTLPAAKPVNFRLPETTQAFY
jgi:signal transduction histidine kinase